ncbi:uncharacterized protein LOC128997289 [Macrosteles quadrilineatus]|uniref:uncharacterized protein LOC128997289 n=1 Tax=Macrosteles quadrilineatus TaxID=74068 RepID=UPI0023E0CB37|nr:uncharacterized protein LOC128997289 [Macrosteles quadrilineatus]
MQLWLYNVAFLAATCLSRVASQNVEENDSTYLEEWGIQRPDRSSALAVLQDLIKDLKESSGEIGGRAHDQFRPTNDRAAFSWNDCRGIYKADYFAKLEIVCYDCYSLFRPHLELYAHCMGSCFANKWFGSCLQVLLTPQEEYPQYKHYVETLAGKPLFPKDKIHERT